MAGFISPPAYAKYKKNYTPLSQYKYEQKALRRVEKEKYKKSLLPESGFMTTQEYEEKSKDVFNEEKVIQEPKLPNDIKMKYVPKPLFKIVKYNDPPGSEEINLKSILKFKRQLNGEGITSPDKSIMVYPSIYFYATNQCTSADLFIIQLDKSLPDLDRILRANVIKKDPEPILSTDKNIDDKYVFRTLTPVDFSPDGKFLAAKEKIGYVNDGIWQTNLWVYNFEEKNAKKLDEVKDAIKTYWKNSQNFYLGDKRWDIYPLGFDADNSNRLVVEAYGYTGASPKFLGTWGIDIDGQNPILISLTDTNAQISINGFKAARAGFENPYNVIASEKLQNKTIKKKRKTEKKVQKKKHKELKKDYKRKIQSMKKEEVQGERAFNKVTGQRKP